MAESILVTGKKISSMELVTNVTGNEKIPTGQPDDLAVTPNQIADHTISRGDLASQEDLSQVEVSLGTQIDDLSNDVTSSNNSIRGLIAAEEAARIAADDLKVDLATTVQTFVTPEAGVDPVTGVADGAFFNVRSSSDESYIDEYQNVGGVATPTGKRYPSSALVSRIQEYTALPYVLGKSYQLNNRVQLDNGDVVKSTVANNTVNPNGDMIGWEFEGKSKAIYNPLNLNYTQVQLATAFTASLNALINKISTSGGGTISIPDGEFSINPSVGGVVLKDNVHLVMGRGTVLKNIASSATVYQMIRVEGVVNASVSGGVLDGNKSGNPSSRGEHGHGVAITGGSNISISNLRVVNTWGDGVYIGRLSSATSINDAISRNIKLADVEVDGSRRQGLSVIAVDGCTVDNLTVRNVNTTNPQAAVDIEPNFADEYIKGLVFNNLVSENCGSGFAVNCLVFDGLTEDKQVIDIVINGHTDNNSGSALAVRNTVGKVKGSILVNNPRYHNQSRGAITMFNHGDGIVTTVINPELNSTSDTAHFVRVSGLSIGDTAIPLGNISLIKPRFNRSVASTVDDIQLSLHSSFTETSYKNISIIDPQKLTHADGRLFSENKAITNLVVSDINSISKKVISANATDPYWGYSRSIVLSADALSNVTYRFNNLPKGRKIRLVNESLSYDFVVIFSSAIVIKGLENKRSYTKWLSITIKSGGFIDIDAVALNMLEIKESFNTSNNYTSEVRQITSATLVIPSGVVTYSINVPLADQNSAVIGVLSPRIEGMAVDAYAVDGVVTATVKNTTEANVTIPIGSYVNIKTIG